MSVIPGSDPEGKAEKHELTISFGAAATSCQPLCSCGWEGDWVRTVDLAEEDWKAHRDGLAQRPRDLSRLAEALNQFVVDASAQRDHWNHRPRAASVAHDEMRLGSENGTEGLVRSAALAFQVSSFQLLAAEDHLIAISRLLLAPGSIYGITTLARSALETSARAYWLLEPELAVRERTARGLTEYLRSLEEGARLADAMRVEVSARDRIRDISSQAEANGFDVIKDHGFLAVDSPRPTATALIGAVLSNSETDLGRAVYGYYSAVAHGTPYGIGALLTTDPTPGSDGLYGARRRFDTAQIAGMVGAAVIAYTLAFDRQVASFGWDNSSRPWRPIRDRAVAGIGLAMLELVGTGDGHGSREKQAVDQ